MKLSRIRSYALIGLAGLLLGGSYNQAQLVVTNKQKVIIYPSKGETIGQLKKQGIGNVENYGSYWVADTDETHFRALRASHGDRAVNGGYLNHIELAATAIDTSVGEPAIPGGLQQVETDGKRLRLVQLKGPIKAVWLDQLRNAGNVKVVTYVPNNAYIVWLDSDAEQKLAGLMEPQGPIHWIGAYHPYYKIPQNLSSRSGNEQIKIRVGVVDQSQDPQAVSGVPTLGSVITTATFNGQKLFEMNVQPSAVAAIAQLPDVVWIEPVATPKLMDEVQDLVLLDQTNQLPFHSPTPRISGGTNYLDFLFNHVGGGLDSFLNPSAYPIVDIADTGLDTGTAFPAHPAFYFAGNPSFGTRIAYLMPPWLAGDPVSQIGCTTRLSDKSGAPFRRLEAVDLDGHGTMVASILAGFDDGTNTLNRRTLVLVTTSNTVVIPVPGGFPGDLTTCATLLGFGQTSSNLNIQVPNGVADVCGGPTFTNVPVTVFSNSCPTNVTAIIAFTRIDTNLESEVRVDPSTGFQLGMGVSPFGLIGIDRIWGTMESGVFTVQAQGGACVAEYRANGFCFNDFIAIMQLPYAASARIQNNSWGDAINIHGDNGGVYTANSQSYDNGVRDAILAATNSISTLNQEFIVIFACDSLLGDAGSQGNAGGFADMRITAPATAKNVISVGAAVNPEDLAVQLVPFTTNEFLSCSDNESSFGMFSAAAPGPTVDGRFKPEIVAPASSIVGAFSQLGQQINIGVSGAPFTNCNLDAMVPVTPDILQSISPGCTSTQTMYTSLYACGNGASFAAPAVSGGIQLLWWYFQNRLTNEVGRPLSQPSPAMAKAYLCNSARYLPITNPQTLAKDTLPSILQGMGEMDLERMFDGIGRVIRDESSPRALDVPLVSTNRWPTQTFFSQSGQSYELGGQIQDTGLPFRVTLAWTDAAGNPVNLQQLVNDLDLEVTIGSQKYRGNVFSEDHSVVGGSPDRVNNMESVFLPAGQTGTYSVVVRAANIAGNGVPNVGNGLGQDFALVVYNSITNSSGLTDVPNLATNNACQTAMPVDSFPFVFTNNLNKATYNNSHPSPTAGLGGIDEFFKLESPDPGITFTIDTFGSSFGTVLSVWEVRVIPQTLNARGECGFLEELVSTEIAPTNGGGGGVQSSLSFTSDGSNTYFIVVEPQNNGDGGTMVLDVNATGTGVTLTPPSLNFADQITGTTSAVQTVTYQKINAGSVTVNSMSIAGSDPADFTISSQTCVGKTLTPNNNSCLINIEFTPQAVGLRTAQLVINDDATGSPRVVPLSGTGTPAAPLICVGPSGSLVFSNTPVGVSSAPQTLTLTNCGTAALVVSNVTFSTTSNDFSVVQTCTGGPIAPGGTCTLTVTFTPAAPGVRQAALIITNSSSINPVTINCRGTGFIPAPALCVGAGTVNFGNVGVDTTGAVQSVTITNCGTATLTISNITVTGANAGDFIITSNSCSTVATGTTCLVQMQFAPSAGGARAANLVITDNAPGSPQLVALVGTGSQSEPDAAVGKNTNVKKMIGFGVINTSGIGQELVQKVHRGARTGLKFYIAVKNSGTANDNFLVHGDGSSGGFTVSYFLGAKPSDSVDVTAAVEAGTFSTSTMAPQAITGSSTMIRVEVLADKTIVAAGTTKTFTLTFTAGSDPSSQDAVRATVIAR